MRGNWSTRRKRVHKLHTKRFLTWPSDRTQVKLKFYYFYPGCGIIMLNRVSFHKCSSCSSPSNSCEHIIHPLGGVIVEIMSSRLCPPLPPLHIPMSWWRAGIIPYGIVLLCSLSTPWPIQNPGGTFTDWLLVVHQAFPRCSARGPAKCWSGWLLVLKTILATNSLKLSHEHISLMTCNYEWMRFN